MFTKSALSAAALAAALVVAQPVTNASAESLVLSEAVRDALVMQTPPATTLAPAGLTPGILLPNPISCGGARNLVKNAGYKKVKKIECNGADFTFKGKKNGQKRFLSVNKYSKQITTL